MAEESGASAAVLVAMPVTVVDPQDPVTEEETAAVVKLKEKCASRPLPFSLSWVTPHHNRLLSLSFYPIRVGGRPPTAK